MRPNREAVEAAVRNSGRISVVAVEAAVVVVRNSCRGEGVAAEADNNRGRDDGGDDDHPCQEDIYP